MAAGQQTKNSTLGGKRDSRGAREAHPTRQRSSGPVQHLELTHTFSTARLGAHGLRGWGVPLWMLS